MKPEPYDHPDLTAYAMGELNSVEAARVRQMLAQSPEARAEYELISQTVNALRDQAPAIPHLTLNPRQRETILAMGQPRVVPMPRRDPIRNAAWTVTKLAAAAAVTAGAFGLGMKYADRFEDLARTSAQPFPQVAVKASPAAAVSTAGPAAEAEQDVASVNTPASLSSDSEVKPLVTAISEQTAPAFPMGAPLAPLTQGVSLPTGAVASAEPETKPEAAPASPPPVETPRPVAQPSLKAFAVAKTQPESFFTVQPKLLRPKIQATQFADLTVAAPLSDRARNNAKASASHKPEPQPALVLHSWDAKIASCPWDSSRRLMRIVAQIPAEQAAVDSNDQDYHLSVKFDPGQVQGYRLIMEKHMPASTTNKLATRFAWYEIIPTKNNTASRDKPATLGVMEVAQPRSAAPGVGNFSRKLVDRGSDWSEMGEAFTFETAMVGFNLLLKGSENVGSLNHRLVLDLAQQSKGDEPNNGERTKFIHAVQQAQKAAGL